MQVFLLPGAPDCGNLGDLAMLQVTIERLGALWPNAVVHVLTRDPVGLREHCPEVKPIPWKGRNRWLKLQALPGCLSSSIPRERQAALPLSVNRWWRLGLLFWPGQFVAVRHFVEAMFRADLVALAGCGLLTDAFAHNADQMLDTLGAAQRCGILTALFSQGLGPMSESKLLRRARSVLPGAGCIFLREPRAGLPLLKSLGLSEAAVRITGDDSIELAARERRQEMGRHIGVNLRLAGYAGVEHSVFSIVRQVLAEEARRREARLLGVPILCAGPNPDSQVVADMIDGLPCAGDPGRSLRRPADVIRRIAECRVVVTGSYHAGVFALAQGVPAIGLAESAYYQDKFLGLYEQFGEGCRVLRTSDPGFTHQLGNAVSDLWQCAPSLRPGLLLAAEAQIQAGRAAYAGLSELLSPSPSSVHKPHPIPSTPAA